MERTRDSALRFDGQIEMMIDVAVARAVRYTSAVGALSFRALGPLGFSLDWSPRNEKKQTSTSYFLVKPQVLISVSDIVIQPSSCFHVSIMLIIHERTRNCISHLPLPFTFRRLQMLLWAD